MALLYLFLHKTGTSEPSLMSPGSLQEIEIEDEQQNEQIFPELSHFSWNSIRWQDRNNKSRVRAERQRNSWNLTILIRSSFLRLAGHFACLSDYAEEVITQMYLLPRKLSRESLQALSLDQIFRPNSHAAQFQQASQIIHWRFAPWNRDGKKLHPLPEELMWAARKTSKSDWL